MSDDLAWSDAKLSVQGISRLLEEAGDLLFDTEMKLMDEPPAGEEGQP